MQTPEEIKEAKARYQRNWTRKNRKKYRAYQRKYHQLWYQENRERAAELQKATEAKRPEFYKKFHKEACKAHRDKVQADPKLRAIRNAKQRAYRLKNIEHFRKLERIRHERYKKSKQRP